MIAVLATATVLALGGVVLEYGFLQYDRAAGLIGSDGPVPTRWAHAGQCLAAAIFAVVVWGRLWATSGKKAFVADHLTELLLAVAALAAVAVIVVGPEGIRRQHGEVIIKAVQVYLLTQLIAVMVKLNMLFVRSVLHPFRSIVGSFAAVIVIGAALLSLPAASYSKASSYAGKDFVDHLFTATSAACVTGLVVRDTGNDYTPFGQVVILILIQLGGLGIVIFGTIFALLIGRQISLHEATLVQDLYSEQALGHVRRIVTFVVAAALIIEAIGAILMFGMWQGPDLTGLQRAFASVFHAVSAYCNAGFALQSDNLVSYAGCWQTYGVILPLVLLGGLGLPVVMNITHIARHRVGKLLRRTRPVRDLDRHRVVGLTLQTKIVVVTSLVLIVAGTAAVFLIETPGDRPRWGRKVEYEDRAVQLEHSTIRGHAVGRRLADSLFHAVSARTAGFSTVDLAPGSVRPATLLVLMALMVVGGSPASTAGGIKTVAFALLLAAVAATLRQRPQVEMFRRRVDQALIHRATALVILFFALVWVLSVVLALTHPQISYLKLLFEATSACGTVGYSTGITSQLTWVGKLCITVGMFAGRLGPLTLLFALTRPGTTARYEYPREGLAIG